MIFNGKPKKKRKKMTAGSTHELKIHPEYYLPVKRGDKTFEVRKYDRDFQVGDWLFLRCFDPLLQEYQEKRVLKRKITYILEGGEFGIAEGYCVIGMKPLLI